MKAKHAVLVLGALALWVGAGYYALTASNTPPAAAQDLNDSAAASTAPAAGPLDIANLTADLGEGDPNAPVKIEEFASLTCPHCARFTNTVYPEIKKAYVDTGKIYFVFTDFPLNAPALDAAAVARCMPDKRYFVFVKFLFQTQEKWSTEGDYKNALRQNAKLAGLDDATFDTCISSEALKQAITDKMKAAGEKHKIESTPSFLINGKDVLKGEMTFEQFQKAITPYLKDNG